MKTKNKIPMRQCTGCREMKSKKEMLRVLKTTEDEIVLDTTGKKNGRGAYLCLSEFIESLGGKVTGSVTSKTNYLINNDTTSNSSKNKKAKELGIPILSEEDFLKMAQQ